MSCTASKPRLWALVDCNSFYCSCERLFRPDLARKPVAVLSNNDGCLVALTPEAKALGCKMGEVYHLSAERLKALGVEVFSSNYTLYGDISDRVMQTLRSVLPVVEKYSIDEAFLPLYPGAAAQAEELGRQIHDRVRAWVGVPVRVGIGETRTLAKLANHWAKRKTRVFRLRAGSPECEALLAQTPPQDLWGIGRRQARKLAQHGIFTARQLRDLDLDRARKLLSVTGQRTVLELRGFQCIMEDDAPVPRQTLITSRSFGRRVACKEDAAEALAMHAAIAGARLREENLVAGTLRVHLSTAYYGPDPYVCLSRVAHLPRPSNLTPDLLAAALRALDGCWQSGQAFLKGGITLFELAPEACRQLKLAEIGRPAADRRKETLMRAVDRVNDRYGRGTMRFLGEGEPDADWRMRRELMSPLYTTKWADLPVAR